MHEHKECEHNIKYCSKCDVCYCEKCGKEWKYFTMSYIVDNQPYKITYGQGDNLNYNIEHNFHI